jgi:hypothetical protein
MRAYLHHHHHPLLIFLKITKETEEGQDDVESNVGDNKQEQDVTASEESPESNDNDDNTIDSQLTNNNR